MFVCKWEYFHTGKEIPHEMAVWYVMGGNMMDKLHLAMAFAVGTNEVG